MIKDRLLFDQILPSINSPEAIIITGMRKLTRQPHLTFFMTA